MTTPITTPAECLLGCTLDGGWKVIERVALPPVATGGCFSVGYIAESQEGARAFLKALDFSRAFSDPDPARVLQAMTEAYNFERDLLRTCNAQKMDRIVRAIGDGSFRVGGTPHGGVVQYLIFELAERDIRLHLAVAAAIDTAWKLRSLHHIATGMKQLHAAGIAHQDLKPSNVLVFEGTTSKIGDLGCATVQGRVGPRDGLCYAGDPSYAPPELLYRYLDPNWNRRRFGCDLYLLGSMAVFFFAGFSSTALLTSQLDRSVRYRAWGGTFEEVLPYLQDAFGKMMEIFVSAVPTVYLKKELRVVVSQLCEPDPSFRGIPSAMRGIGSQFALDRYVSKFDLLARRAELEFFKG